jgi:dinuclear metal center YbgI/SA1388 family protein
MPQLQSVREFLDHFAPPILAESWDNTGLLAGDPGMDVHRVMTCLTITPDTAAEAIAQQADLIVSHHPLPFRPLQKLVTETTPGRLVWELLTHRIAIYSPHTSFDSALYGINQSLADGLGLIDTQPLIVPADAPPGTGTGRLGRVQPEVSLRAMAERLKRFLVLPGLQYVGPLDMPIERVAIACGAAGELLTSARRAGCHLLVLGETNLHTCLEAQATGVALLLPGHYASERFAVEDLAERLGAQFGDVEVWASSVERDPLNWV